MCLAYAVSDAAVLPWPSSLCPLDPARLLLRDEQEVTPLPRVRI